MASNAQGSFPDIGLVEIPPVPALALRLLELCNDDQASAEDLARLVETDPALSTRLLRLVNSAFYGLPQEVTSIRRAVIIQGFGRLRELALHLLIFDAWIRRDSRPGFDLLFFWQHSLFVAYISRLLGAQLHHPDPEHLYVAGLLHDIGKLVIETSGRIPYSDFLNLEHKESSNILAAEQAFLGASHDQVGAHCAYHWHLPKPLLQAMEAHHGSQPLSRYADEEARDISLISFADFIAWMQGMGSTRQGQPPPLPDGIMLYLNMARIDLPKLLEDADAEMNRIASFYRLSFPSPMQQRGHLLQNLIHHLQPSADQTMVPSPSCAYSLTAAHQSLDPNHFIPLVLSSMTQELDMKRVVLWRTMSQHRGLGFLACHPKEVKSNLPQEISGKNLTPGIVGALRGLEARYLRQEIDQPLLTQLQCHQALIAPVQAQGRLYGLLWLDRGEASWPANEHLAEEVGRVSHELGIALSNSATLAREKKRADLDGLTGLHNRASIDRLLKKAFADYQAGGPGMVLGLVDVDKFKIFNDNFGHQAGDDVLKVVAQSLSALLRPEDILGRYGGDEFLFALIGTKQIGALAYAERVRQEVERRGQLLAQRFKGHAITISQGLAATGPGINTLEELIAAADDALYKVKRGNRNEVLIAPDTLLQQPGTF